MNQIQPYYPKHKVRIVTAASLFDGHDAAINIMRRIIQATGVEVIHLGHDRSVEEVKDSHNERLGYCRKGGPPVSELIENICLENQGHNK